MWADYACKDCGEIFEYKKEFGKEFPKHPICIKCNSTNTERFYSNMSFIFPPGEIGGNAKNNYSSATNLKK